MEYLLLLAVVATVVFVGFKAFLPKVQESSENYFNQVSRVIKGEDPLPVDGKWCDAYCPDPDACGPAAISRVCGCPAPAFGGAYCPGSPFIPCLRSETCGKACNSVMEGKCNQVPPDPACRCTIAQDDYVCGPPIPGVDECMNTCAVPPSNGVAPVACDANCPTAEPTGTDCRDTRAQVPAGTTWKVVANQGECSGSAPCTKYCDLDKEPGINANGKPDCVDPYCHGQVPQNSVNCVDDADLYAGQEIVLVAECSGAGCEYVCNSVSHYKNGICEENQCYLPPPVDLPAEKGRLCFDSVKDVPSDGASWNDVVDCSMVGLPKCSYLKCPVGQHAQPDDNGFGGRCVN